MKYENLTISVGGRDIIIETGKIARQANGSVLLRCGETILLTTACSSPSADPNVDFFPLRVDYQEKFSATGKTLGGFIKREGRPSEKEILTSRLIDRPIRPMFEDGYFNEVQVLSYVMSYDGVHSPESLAICSASAALVISDIPMIKPIGAVKLGLVKNQLIVNPTIAEQAESKLDLVLAGTEDAILMIEGTCDFLTEEQLLEAIEEGHESIVTICKALSDWQNIVGKPKKRDSIKPISQDLIAQIDDSFAIRIKDSHRVKEKQARATAQDAITNEVLEKLITPEATYSKVDVLRALKNRYEHHMRRMILDEGIRIDGRGLEDIRPISIEMGLLPRTHGSSLFTRGETQSLAVCTLGGESMGQRFESLDEPSVKRFYLQYNFPPFSVGEVGKSGSPSRREIGHGKLAEQALKWSLPTSEVFPYTVRLESNITESNGSSSMASVCGGCLALMEAGVPIQKPVSGIAMGLILDGDNFAILSDIMGAEDALGDMDFKVTGNSEGVTAFQLDIKVEGITHQIMKAALAQAKQGRIHILQKMLEVCSKPKEHLSKYAPHIERIQVKPSKIGAVIGSGGKQIRAIMEETGTEIEIDDAGIVNISANSRDSAEKAKQIIIDLTSDIEVGKTYKGKITSIVAFGLFVQIFGKEGLCHISEISHERVANPNDLFKVGQEIEVKVLDINDRGQIKLSRKVLIEKS